MDCPDVFTFHFKMMDSKGRLIESSEEAPISIIEGKYQVFASLEKALLKLRPGDRKRVAINSKDAFGEYDTDLVVQVPQSKFADVPSIGDEFDMDDDGGSTIKMRMVDEKHGLCILDGNHQLAGVDLLFEVQILKRRPATSKEMRTGKIN